MQHPRLRRPTLLVAVLAAAISLVAVGCGSSDSGSDEDHHHEGRRGYRLGRRGARATCPTRSGSPTRPSPTATSS